MTHALVGTRTLRFFARERRRVSLGEAFPSDTPGRVPARVPGEMSSGASTRATLRRLLRVASRYDVERPHLKALLPSPSARGDGSAKTTLRDLVRRTALDPAGHGLPVADPPRARALVHGNLDALETVMRRAEAQTAVQRRDARAISAGGSASGGSDAALSVARAGDHLGRPRLEMADAVRRAVDTTLTRVSAERLASITHDASAEPWLRRAGARETRRRRGATASATASASFDASRSPFPPRPRRKGHPNAAWYADRLDVALEGEADATRTSRTSRTREYPDTSASRVTMLHGRLARLFREARAVGCPPNASDVARAVTFLAETTTKNDEKQTLGDDARLADASERAVDAALRLAWTFFRPPNGDADDEASDLEASDLGAAADAVVAAAALSAAATPAGSASKRARTARALNLLHAHMDVCGRAPGRDAAAAAVAVAARFVADESGTARVAKAPTKAATDHRSEETLGYDWLARTVARLESLGVGVAPRARRAVLAAAEKSSGLDEAFAVLKRWKRSGGSPDADAVLGLLEWAVEAGDDEKARWLEEELAATGKGAYLASLNSPGC